ncbi:anthranilate synthase component I [Enterococcus sp. LJL120]
MRRLERIPADNLTVISAYLRIQGRHKALLESIPRDQSKSRYSVIAWNPVKDISYKDGLMQINQETFATADPLKELEKIVITQQGLTEELPFQGGVIGYAGYDVIAAYEDIGQLPQDELGIADLHFYLYESFLIFDHAKEEIILVEDNCYSQRESADLSNALEKVQQDLRVIAPTELSYLQDFHFDFTSNFTQEEFETTVKKVKDYIKAGDIFQMVPSQRLTTDFKIPPFDYYRHLRISNPSAYLYYLDFGDTKVIGSSPESLVSVKEDIVTTNPIAGTRKRGADKAEDQRLAEELLADEKERAEHMMLIDLGRNDLSRVSEVGSVTVPVLMIIEKYRYVMHIVSLVTGKLAAGKTTMDALKATLPAGTVSGAPKIRAMQRIYEFEPVRRGIYAGAVGYFSQDDQGDFAIAIRTMVVHQEKAYVQAGAGIVYDSDPTSEYFETLQKAKALLEVHR